MGFPDGSVVKNPPANAGDTGDKSSIPGLGRSPGRKWQPTPVFLPWKSHGQRRTWWATVHGVSKSQMLLNTEGHTHNTVFHTLYGHLICFKWGNSWRRTWQPTPVFLPGRSHGWRNLVGYSPCGCEELDMTERLHFHFFIFLIFLLKVFTSMF